MLPPPMYLCTRPGCRHHYAQHHAAGGACRVSVSKDWDGTRFQAEDHCDCSGYLGIVPATDGCPHEFIKDNPKCVQCGRAKAPRL